MDRVRAVPPTGDLEQRIRTLEDRDEITTVIHLYGRHADTGDHDAFVELFTEDAVIRLIGGTPSGAYGETVEWVGHEQIRAYIDDPSMHMKIEGRCMHLPALNLTIEIDGNTATADSCSLVLLRENDETSIYGAGFTRWRLARSPYDGRWRISERVRTAIGTKPAS